MRSFLIGPITCFWPLIGPAGLEWNITTSIELSRNQLSGIDQFHSQTKSSGGQEVNQINSCYLFNNNLSSGTYASSDPLYPTPSTTMVGQDQGAN